MAVANRHYELRVRRNARHHEKHLLMPIAVYNAGRRAVSASWDGTLKVWDLESDREERTLEGHSYWVMAVAVYGGGPSPVLAEYSHPSGGACA
jgi:WD40 repeat protein